MFSLDCSPVQPIPLALRHLLPETCAKLVRRIFGTSASSLTKIVRTQLLRNFCADIVPRTNSTQFSQPDAIFLKSAAVQDRSASTLRCVIQPNAKFLTEVKEKRTTEDCLTETCLVHQSSVAQGSVLFS